ncbi:MAG: U32 family peptidase [Candidatus Nanoarchaeia archaeon]|nr:U32 family peptidase [Candidatus Nanoarchaeia archaeon]MDD5587912.1 U32 family peptidase [Candidatus Nanoarchaeia archaeon]
MKNKPELLSPVSDFTSLTASIKSGCNAIYFGVKELNMRITANNFTLNELKKVVDICHKNKVKAYLTLNTIIYNNELNKIKKILKTAKKAKIDAIICWDFSVIQEVKKLKLPFHISTQASVSNIESAKFYKNLGAERIILARELSLEQIKEIKKKSNIQVECFIHGAMCVALSGRCFTSQFVFGRSANRGDCLQPCRRNYIVKDKRIGYELGLENDAVLSPKDLCTLPFIEKLIEAGIDAFKIEGRARSPDYVSVVTRVYRKAIDAYFENKLTNNFKQALISELKTVYNRDFSSGFYLGKPINEFTSPDNQAIRKKVLIGIVKNYYKNINVAEIKLLTKDLKINDLIMIQGPTTGVIEQKVNSIEINDKKVDIAKKGAIIGIKFDNIVRKNDKVFLINKLFK